MIAVRGEPGILAGNRLEEFDRKIEAPLILSITDAPHGFAGQNAAQGQRAGAVLRQPIKARCGISWRGCRVGKSSILDCCGYVVLGKVKSRSEFAS